MSWFVWGGVCAGGGGICFQDMMLVAGAVMAMMLMSLHCTHNVSQLHKVMHVPPSNANSKGTAVMYQTTP